ncbi:MAG: PSP1 domain-containing protein [Anaerolineales bacterium]
MITQELQDAYPATIRVVSVKVRDRGEVKKMGAGDAVLRAGDYVMLEMGGELTYGTVYTEPQPLPFIPPMRVMKSILRKATAAETAVIPRHEHIAKEGMAYCRERAAFLDLDMKMVEVFCSFQRREITFVYTSEERVDFRQLVRELARRFGGRIEMRHIGPREEARRLGGVDTCGLVVCCATFLTDFTPVSVRKARDLDPSLSESRLIGLCGRLKCCLMFEAQGGTPAPPSLIHPTHPSRPARPDEAVNHQ